MKIKRLPLCFVHLIQFIDTGVVGKFLCVQYLGVAVQGSMMQGSASTAVWHVDAAEQGDDDLGTSQRIVGRGDMQRGLPVLVPCVDVSGVVDQDSHYFLKRSVKDRVISLVFVYSWTACDQLINITWARAVGEAEIREGFCLTYYRSPHVLKSIYDNVM